MHFYHFLDRGASNVVEYHVPMVTVVLLLGIYFFWGRGAGLCCIFMRVPLLYLGGVRFFGGAAGGAFVVQYTARKMETGGTVVRFGGPKCYSFHTIILLLNFN